MLTITTERRSIYINIDLLRSKLKKVIIIALKALTNIFIFVGVLWILGTVGASDNNNITFYQLIIQTLQGFFLCGIAYILNIIQLFVE